MPLQPGDKLGPYTILALVGRGGMGEVYRARDPRLNRDVAIKVSAAHFSERFDREAKAIAALNHSNICQIYDVGPNYLVMEYVEGAPLKGPLPLDEALRYAAQICAALDAAHNKGITHRDLKPANILVPKSGIKLLDFGLAKLSRDSNGAGATTDPDNTPTLTMALTGKNEIVGTLYYMSPEQLQAQATGKEIDSRSDIFSFGLVLYEMLTGKRAFQGSSPASVIAAIMERPAPSISDIAPPALDRVLRKCMAKDPDERWQTARDLKDELEWIANSPSGVGSPGGAGFQPAAGLQPGQSSPLSKIAVAAAAVFALAAVGLGIVAYRATRPAPLPEITRFEIHAPAGSTLPLGTPAVSPDGRTLAYAVADKDKLSRIYVRTLDSTEPRVLPGTEGAVHPFFSPDGRSLGFVANGKLQRIDLAGGSPRALADTGSPWHGSWNQNGTILFNNSGAAAGVFQISANGGPATPVLAADGHPYFLPDGKRFLGRNAATGKIELGTLGSQGAKLVLDNASSAAFAAPVPGGATYMFFIQGSDVMAQQFNEASGALVGEPAAIIDNIGRVANPAVTPTLGVSRSGTLAFQRDIGGGLGRLTWFDRSGKPLSELPAAAVGQRPALSPDGRFAAIVRRDFATATSDIWVVDLERGASTRLSFEKGLNNRPVWSRDGKRVTYSSAKGITEKDASGTGTETLLLNSEGAIPDDWSPDGKYLLYEKGNQLALLPTAGDKKPIPVGSRNGRSRIGRFSPDGKFIAYDSDESGKREVYVQPTPPATGRWQVSTAGGDDPRWRRDGKELFFGAPGGLLAVDVKSGATFTAGLPHQLMGRPTGTFSFQDYDVSADGQRFLLYTAESTEADAPITVVQNWWVALKK